MSESTIDLIVTKDVAYPSGKIFTDVFVEEDKVGSFEESLDGYVVFGGRKVYQTRGDVISACIDTELSHCKQQIKAAENRIEVLKRAKQLLKERAQ